MLLKKLPDVDEIIRVNFEIDWVLHDAMKALAKRKRVGVGMIYHDAVVEYLMKLDNHVDNKTSKHVKKMGTN
jgi:hypothetical protein